MFGGVGALRVYVPTTRKAKHGQVIVGTRVSHVFSDGFHREHVQEHESVAMRGLCMRHLEGKRRSWVIADFESNAASSTVSKVRWTKDNKWFKEKHKKCFAHVAHKRPQALVI